MSFCYHRYYICKQIDITSLYLGIHFVVDDVVEACPPVTDLHSLACGDNVLSHALWWSYKRLPLTDPQHVVEVLADHATSRFKLVSCSTRETITMTSALAQQFYRTSFLH